jgi:hypothetical protein
MARRNPVRQTPKGAAVQTTIGFTLYRTKGGAVFVKDANGEMHPFASEGQFFAYLAEELERLRKAGRRTRQ